MKTRLIKPISSDKASENARCGDGNIVSPNQVHHLGHHLHLGGVAAICWNASQPGVRALKLFPEQNTQYQVYDVDNKTYLVKLHQPDKKVVLLIESGTR